MLMFGSFRRGEANDAEVYAMAVAKVLSSYDYPVIDYVTDPVTGMAGKGDFLPTVAELKRACDAKAAQIARAGHWDRLARQTLEERKAITDQRQKKTYDELVADCHAKGLLIGPQRPSRRDPDINAFLQEHGVSREQFDALPNAPDYRWK